MSNGVAGGRSDFEDLSGNLVDFILKKLISASDYIRFGAVCRRWRRAALEQKQHRVISASYHHRPPLLILRLKLYDFCENKVYTDDKMAAIPSAHRNRQFHSGFAEYDFAITLINPFTNDPPIRLPPVMLPASSHNDLRDYDMRHPECAIHKVFLSCDPSAHPHSYAVAVIFHSCWHAAFIRSGEKNWTGINKSFMDVCDIVFSDLRLFAINLSQELIAIDYYSGSLETSVADRDHMPTAATAVMESLVDRGDDPRRYSRICYILDMGNQELLHVVRFYLRNQDGDLHDAFITAEFKLYKLRDGDVLFLGGNASILTSPTPSFRPSSIYFTEDMIFRCAYDDHSTDMGIFDIQTKIIDKLSSSCRLSNVLWAISHMDFTAILIFYLFIMEDIIFTCVCFVLCLYLGCY